MPTKSRVSRHSAQKRNDADDNNDDEINHPRVRQRNNQLRQPLFQGVTAAAAASILHLLLKSNLPEQEAQRKRIVDEIAERLLQLIEI